MTFNSSSDTPMCKTPVFPTISFLLILLLLPATSSSSMKTIHSFSKSAFCNSWVSSVENNNAGPWEIIPANCKQLVSEYMLGPRYISDSEVAAAYSLAYAKEAITGDVANSTWIFDIDETLVSNLPYYRSLRYGEDSFNQTSWNQWVEKACAPAIPASLKLYNELKTLGFKLVLLTGRFEEHRKLTEKNLKLAGYNSWKKLILRHYSDKKGSDLEKTAVVYKSEKRAMLESEGFKIRGNSGDQWSDLLGTPMAERSFKHPNPMYYTV